MEITCSIFIAVAAIWNLTQCLAHMMFQKSFVGCYGANETLKPEKMGGASNFSLVKSLGISANEQKPEDFSW